MLQLGSAIEYIAGFSITNAEKVRADVLEKVERLLKYPEANPLDKYKTNNDGGYRAFEVHRLSHFGRRNQNHQRKKYVSGTAGVLKKSIDTRLKFCRRYTL